MSGTAPEYMSVAEQARLIERKEISPVDLVKLYLERIGKWDGVLHSWITVCGERALEHARAAEAEIAAGDYRGPLHGIPFGVKDQIKTKGVRTTMASVIEEDFGSDENATVITRLEAAGAILLGKNNLHEFGKGGSVRFHFGEPRNPWNLSYEPSHSSTGSGVATAAGLCSASIGEDTGGSVRGPAWANGVVGIRPTFGRVSRYGGIMYGWSQDTIAPLTRTVEDNAIFLQAMAGNDPKDPLSSRRPVPDYGKSLGRDLKGLKLGLVREMSVGHDLHPEVERTLKDALGVLRDLGAEIEEISLPRTKYAVPLQYLTTDADVAAVFMEKWLRKDWDKFDVGIRTRVAAAAMVPASVYSRAMRGRVLVRQEILDALKTYDGLLALMNFVPPMPVDAPKETIDSEKDITASMFKSRRICTYPFSLANVPAISVPNGFTREDNVPMAFQIAAKPFDEETVYRVAHAYEQATPWHKRHPDLNVTAGPALPGADAVAQ